MLLQQFKDPGYHPVDYLAGVIAGCDCPGPPGADGKSIYAGDGDPTLSVNVGDLYIDAVTGNLWRLS